MIGTQSQVTTAKSAQSASSRFVYDSIYTAILEKRLAPTTRLNKETLGRIFQVSASTIQRALSRLAEEGAVVMEPNQIASIARPTECQARQVLEARILIESEVIRLVGRRLGREQFAELRGLVAEQRRCLAAGDRAGLTEGSARFHLLLAEYAGNPLLLKFLRGLLSRASLTIALNKEEVLSAGACDEQLNLLAALEAGDTQAATEMLIGHLNTMFERMRFAPPPTTDLRRAFEGRLKRPVNARSNGSPNRGTARRGSAG